MNRHNSAKVSRTYLDCFDPLSTVASGEPQSRFAGGGSGNSREQNKTEVKRRLTLENKLHCLSWILSVSFICLILISLAWEEAPRSSKVDKPQANPALKEAALGEKIRRELVTLRRVFDNVSFHLDENNIVTLSGQVQLRSLKVSAQRAARNIEGVRGVINQLEVLPTSSFDEDIRRTSPDPLAQPAQPLRSPGYSSDSHHREKRQPTLEGVVASESDKTNVGIRANQVSNSV